MKTLFLGSIFILIIAMNTAGQIKFYTGSYNYEGAPAPAPIGDGIGIFDFNTETGEVKPHGYQEQRNPSYLCISSDNKYLFAAEELPEGNGAKLYSYRIAKDTLELVDSKDIEGGYACHLAICKNHIVIANYMSGNALIFEILEKGQLSPCKQIIKNHGNGPNKARQEASHMHMAYPWGTDKIFLVDLSLDNAQSYYFDQDQQNFILTEENNLKVGAGAGARHMVISDDNSMAFILGELSGEIFGFENINGIFIKRQTISYLEEGTKASPSGAAIKIHPNSNFVYASDRATNMIAIYKVNKQTRNLSLIGFQETYGKSPRDFEIDPTGNWLLVANQDSNNLVVFRINKENGSLTRESSLKVNTPVNICFQYQN